jgi:hypothetical protein
MKKIPHGTGTLHILGKFPLPEQAEGRFFPSIFISLLINDKPADCNPGFTKPVSPDIDRFSYIK